MMNDREIATLILLVVPSVLCIGMAGIRRSLGEVVRAFLQYKFIAVVLTFFLYAVLLVWISALIGLWGFKLLTDTILVTLTVGFPMLLGAAQAQDGALLVRKVVRATFGASAIIAFYVNLA